MIISHPQLVSPQAYIRQYGYLLFAIILLLKPSFEKRWGGLAKIFSVSPQLKGGINMELVV